MIKAGVPVFFGCDVGKFSDSVGIMDPELFAYEVSSIFRGVVPLLNHYSLFQSAFDITLGLTKAERLQVNESAMTHAMVISGVHLDAAGKPVRYKVENSWGEDAGHKGYYMMTDKWFEEWVLYLPSYDRTNVLLHIQRFVYQIVVPKALAPKDLVKVFEAGGATVLPPWDPMVRLL